MTKQVYIDINAGLSTVKPTYGKTTTNSNITAAITDELSETETITVAYTKTTLPSASTPDIFDAWKLTAKISRQLAERIKTTAEVFYGKGTFKQNNTKDQQSGGRLNIAYTLTKNTTVFISYTYKKIRSTDKARQYARNLIEAGMQITF